MAQRAFIPIEWCAVYPHIPDAPTALAERDEPAEREGHRGCGGGALDAAESLLRDSLPPKRRVREGAREQRAERGDDALRRGGERRIEVSELRGWVDGDGGRSGDVAVVREEAVLPRSAPRAAERQRAPSTEPNSKISRHSRSATSAPHPKYCLPNGSAPAPLAHALELRDAAELAAADEVAPVRDRGELTRGFVARLARIHDRCAETREAALGGESVRRAELVDEDGRARRVRDGARRSGRHPREVFRKKYGVDADADEQLKRKNMTERLREWRMNEGVRGDMRN
jgi:hypothetical protein